MVMNKLTNGAILAINYAPDGCAGSKWEPAKVVKINKEDNSVLVLNLNTNKMFSIYLHRNYPYYQIFDSEKERDNFIVEMNTKSEELFRLWNKF